MKVIKSLPIIAMLMMVDSFLAQPIQAACTASGTVYQFGYGIEGIEIQYCYLDAGGEGCGSGVGIVGTTDWYGNFSGPIVCPPPFTPMGLKFFSINACYVLDPGSITITGYTGGDISSLVFSENPYNYKIGGKVADAYGTGISGVTMTGLPGSPVTDSMGNYLVTVTCNASYHVTPYNSCYSFTPPYIDYTAVQEYHYADNYLATLLTYTISGYVKTSDGAGIQGVTLSGLPGNPVTDASGFYSSKVPCGWQNTVQPQSPGISSFNPASIPYSTVGSDQANQNYTANGVEVLFITKTGFGNGTVVSQPSGINCGNTCSTFFSINRFVLLAVTPDVGGSIFIAWTGDSDCSDGSLTMITTRSCAAKFDICGPDFAFISAISGGTMYGSIAEAYAGASGVGPVIIYITATNQQETINMDKGKIVTLAGGRDCGFAWQPNSYTTITGALTISNGSVTMDSIVVL